MGDARPTLSTQVPKLSSESLRRISMHEADVVDIDDDEESQLPLFPNFTESLPSSELSLEEQLMSAFTNADELTSATFKSEVSPSKSQSLVVSRPPRSATSPLIGPSLSMPARPAQAIQRSAHANASDTEQSDEDFDVAVGTSGNPLSPQKSISLSHAMSLPPSIAALRLNSPLRATISRENSREKRSNRGNEAPTAPIDASTTTSANDAENNADASVDSVLRRPSVQLFLQTHFGTQVLVDDLSNQLEVIAETHDDHAPNSAFDSEISGSSEADPAQLKSRSHLMRVSPRIERRLSHEFPKDAPSSFAASQMTLSNTPSGDLRGLSAERSSITGSPSGYDEGGDAELSTSPSWRQHISERRSGTSRRQRIRVTGQSVDEVPEPPVEEAVPPIPPLPAMYSSPDLMVKVKRAAASSPLVQGSPERPLSSGDNSGGEHMSQQLNKRSSLSKGPSGSHLPAQGKPRSSSVGKESVNNTGVVTAETHVFLRGTSTSSERETSL